MRFDAVGGVAAFGYTVRYPSAVVSATVVFRTTAETPEDGIPPCPVKLNGIDVWPATGRDDRVSRTRAGFTATNMPGLVAVPPR